MFLFPRHSLKRPSHKPLRLLLKSKAVPRPLWWNEITIIGLFFPHGRTTAKFCGECCCWKIFVGLISSIPKQHSKILLPFSFVMWHFEKKYSKTKLIASNKRLPWAVSCCWWLHTVCKNTELLDLGDGFSMCRSYLSLHHTQNKFWMIFWQFFQNYFLKMFLYVYYLKYFVLLSEFLLSLD